MSFFNRDKENKTVKERAIKPIQGALSYEEDKERMYKRSNKIAWTIATVSFLLLPVTIGLGGYALNEIVSRVSEPKIIGFDKSTGAIDYLTVVNKDSVAELEARENLDKFFVNQYIQNRESYTWQTIQKTYNLTQLFSNEPVAEEFRKEYARKDSLDQILKKSGTAKVQVISITLENIGNEQIATARIKVDYALENNTGYSRNYSIRLAYEYKPQAELALSGRIENPVGFFVTSYQRVQENL